jgi:GNAT superfamily N-acetyltransferase
MKLQVFKSELKEILPLRKLFLEENHFQIRYNACHERNWSDSYLFTIDALPIGYGSIKGKEDLKNRDTVFEFFIVAQYRSLASQFFIELIKTSGVVYVESQSNELLSTRMLYEFGQDIRSDVILFKDSVATEWSVPNINFRLRAQEDVIFHHTLEPVGEYVLEQNKKIVATGGFLKHYNFPYADLYMEVDEDYRKMGLGNFLLQEIKKECYKSGRVPAARCNIQNKASQAALLKAGLVVAGFMLEGVIKNIKP